MLFTTAVYNRSSLVTSLINDYLIQHQSELTCIDFSLDPNDDLIISRLCIDSPYGDVELIDTLIEWRFEASYLHNDRIVDAISAITISSAKVRAKGAIQLPESSATAKFQLKTLPSLIRQQLNNVTLLSAPIDLKVQSFSYQPFRDNDAKEKLSYQGEFSITEQQLFLSLSTSKQADIFDVQVTKAAQGFNAELVTELTGLKTFLLVHKTALPVVFADVLTGESTDNWAVSGHFESQINWHKQSLKMSSQLTDFSLHPMQDITQDKAVKLGGTLSWQANLNDETLKIDFVKANNLQVSFEQDVLIKLLTENSSEPQLIEFLTDNVIDSFNVQPSGSMQVDFAKQMINSDGLDFSSQNLNETIELSVNNIALNYHDEPAIAAELLQAGFYLSGPLQLAQLNSFTQRPVIMNLVGDIKQQSDSWQLMLAPSSTLELSQLALPADIPKSNSQISNPRVQARLKSLLSHWQGKITIPKSETQDKIIKVDEMSFDLQIDNQIKQLALDKVIEIETLAVTGELNGSFSDVAIKANVIAGQLEIALLQISGDIFQPQVEVQAKEMFLTDLLALKIALPVEVKLIDGLLNYHLSGQFKNTGDLMANPMKLTLSVKELTGEVDGTWIQELNWQQKFMIKNGQVKSLVEGSNTENNLTIAKIETATPITNLSTQILVDYEQGEVKVKVNNTNGKLLGGRFDIAQAQWPFSKGSAVNVKLTKIDLEKLLELDKKQGIVVTGRVSGMLPIEYDGKYFLIKEGSLHNVGDGLIQVYNNPAVEELKTSSTELKLAFDALENLHYHHLSSDVSMADDGYMLLVTAIKGRNPDLDNDVNLNLNLSYDLLGLLESLNITEHFESKVIKGLQR